MYQHAIKLSIVYQSFFYWLVL